MLKELTRILVLQLFFFVIANTGQAENSDMSPVFKATEKLMDKEISQFYATHNQVELLNYMKKFNDTQSVARLTEKLSAHSPTVKDIGTFTFYEKHIALALQYLGQKRKAKERMNSLLSIASFQGQAGLYDDMAKTISLIDTNDGEALNTAWQTIKATLDLHAKQTAQ